MAKIYGNTIATPINPDNFSGGGSITIDQTFSPNSQNAQSGIAISKEISDTLKAYYTKDEVSEQIVINVSQTYDPESKKAQSGVAVNGALNDFRKSLEDNELNDIHNEIYETNETIKELHNMVVPWQLEYENKGNYIKITGVIDNHFYHLEIPDYIDGLSVTEIDIEAFANCYELETIVLPKTLEYIGSSAFIYCSSLREIEIPEGVTYIGSCAFSGCNRLEKVIMPISVYETSEKVFDGAEDLHIYYAGTKEDWENIKNVDGFTERGNVTVHYNYSPATKNYVDEQIGDIETVLDELHDYANSLVNAFDTVHTYAQDIVNGGNE